MGNLLIPGTGNKGFTSWHETAVGLSCDTLGGYPLWEDP